MTYYNISVREFTHVVYAVDERVVTAVAHCQPIATEPNDIYVSVPAKTRSKHNLLPRQYC